MKELSITFNRVTFNKPFVLKGLIGLQTAGTYSVETHQKKTKWDFFYLSKNLKKTTWIRTCQSSGQHGAIRFTRIDPCDLRIALANDSI